MSSIETKLLIAESLVRLTDSQPLEKVSVSDIVTESGKNRKTFYYHFTDKRSLIVWIFRHDLANELRRTVTEADLGFERDAAAGLEDFPYYTFIKEGVRSVDGTKFVSALAAVLEGRRKFYAQALNDSSPEGLAAYLRELYTPALVEDARFILSNRFLNSRNVRFLAEFYVSALVSYFTLKLNSRGNEPLTSDFGPFLNIVHASIADEISRHQQGRTL